ncbi:hypothetical protein RFI_19263, partial [Reticulomyxa filosa]
MKRLELSFFNALRQEKNAKEEKGEGEDEERRTCKIQIFVETQLPYLSWDCPLDDNSELSLVSRVVSQYMGFGYTLEMKLCNMELKTNDGMKMTNNGMTGCIVSNGMLHTLYGVTPQMSVFLECGNIYSRYNNNGNIVTTVDPSTSTSTNISTSANVDMTTDVDMEMDKDKAKNVYQFTEKNMKVLSISRPEQIGGLLAKKDKKPMFVIANGERLFAYSHETNQLKHVQNIPKAPIIDLWTWSNFVFFVRTPDE